MDLPSRASLLLLALVGTPARAMRIPWSPQVRCDRAELVLAAEVTGLSPRWAEGVDGGIETVVDLHPLGLAKGRVGSELVLVLPGGRMGDIELWVEDVPSLALDQRYLLYLRVGPDGRHRVVGGEEGARRIDATVVGPDPVVAALQGACHG